MRLLPFGRLARIALGRDRRVRIVADRRIGHAGGWLCDGGRYLRWTRRVGRGLRRLLSRRNRRMRDAEIGDQDPPVFADENVVGLEAAMDETGVVRGRQTAPGCFQHLENLAPWASFANPPAQRRTIDEFHGDVDARAEGADVVNRHHVRMIQLHHRLRFAHSFGAHVCLGLGAQYFQRDDALDLTIVRGIHRR
jgi:hypothetical protein